MPYLITLTRAEATFVALWPVSLSEPLPVVSVPLREPDPDIPLDLGQAFTAVYDEAAYDLSIDYQQTPPPPTLSDDDLAWMQELMQK